MGVWHSWLKGIVIVSLVAPMAMGQAGDVGVDLAGPLNDTGAVPDCQVFPGLTGGADVSTGPGGGGLARTCRAATAVGLDRLVTGHSVFVEQVAHPAPEVRFLSRYAPYTVPDRGDLVPETPAVTELLPIEHGQPPANEVKMAECVAWFNGHNVNARPAVEGQNGYNTHFSDNDQPATGYPNHDVAGQDHDPARHVTFCHPENMEQIADATGQPIGTPTDFAVLAGALWTDGGARHGSYAIVVERGDCAPSAGGDFRFRAHLDFVDPNNVYHEVQEYDYLCPWAGPGNILPGDIADTVAGLLPQPGAQAEPLSETQRCDPVRMMDTTDPAPDQRRCRGSLQDLMRERLWITRVHDPVWDPTTRTIYTFALAVDTCATVNVHDGVASRVAGQQVTPLDRSLDPGGLTLDTYPHPLYPLLDQLYPTGGGRLQDACVDGSSFSFDDTERGRDVHSGPPPGWGTGQLMDGNSYDFDGYSDTVATHRTNCRHNWIDWPYNAFPPGLQADCYAEDHATAVADLYVYEADPTGHFAANSNGMTGFPNAYHGHGFPSGPNCGTPGEPPCDPWT